MTVLTVPASDLFNISISLDKSLFTGIKEAKSNEDAKDQDEDNGVSTEIYLVNKRMDQCLGTLRLSLTATDKPSTPFLKPQSSASKIEVSRKSESSSSESRLSESRHSESMFSESRVRESEITENQTLISSNASCQKKNSKSASFQGPAVIIDDRVEASGSREPPARKTSLFAALPNYQPNKITDFTRKLSCGANLTPRDISPITVQTKRACSPDDYLRASSMSRVVAIQSELKSRSIVSPTLMKTYGDKYEDSLPLRKRSAMRPSGGSSFMHHPELTSYTSPVKIEPCENKEATGSSEKLKLSSADQDSHDNDMSLKRKRKISIFQGRPSVMNWQPEDRDRSPSLESTETERGVAADADDEEYDENSGGDAETHGHFKTIAGSPVPMQGSSFDQDDAKRKCSLFYNGDFNPSQLAHVPGNDDYYRKISALSLGGISFNPEDGFESLDELEGDGRDPNTTPVRLKKKSSMKMEPPDPNGTVQNRLEKSGLLTVNPNMIRSNMNVSSKREIIQGNSGLNGAMLQKMVHPVTVAFLQQQQQQHQQQQQLFQQEQRHINPVPMLPFGAAPSQPQIPHPVPPQQLPQMMPPLLHVAQTNQDPQSISPQSMYSSDGGNSSPVSTTSFGNIQETMAHRRRPSLTPEPQSSTSKSMFGRPSTSGGAYGARSNSASASGGRMATCDLCPYQAKHPYQIKLHKRNCHSDERPYQCNYCWYASKQRCNLNRHIRQVHRHANTFSSSASVPSTNPGTPSMGTPLGTPAPRSVTGTTTHMSNFAHSSISDASLGAKP